MSAVHPLWRNIDYKEIAVYFVRVGRLFLIFQIQNCNYQKTNGQDDGSYVVTVTYEQMNVFAPTLENYMTTVEEMVTAWTEAALAGEETPSEEEMMAEVIGAFETTLADVLANVTYAEPQTMTVRIELVDGLYTPNEDDLYNLEYSLFDNDAIE